MAKNHSAPWKERHWWWTHHCWHHCFTLGQDSSPVLPVLCKQLSREVLHCLPRQCNYPLPGRRQTSCIFSSAEGCSALLSPSHPLQAPFKRKTPITFSPLHRAKTNPWCKQSLRDVLEVWETTSVGALLLPVSDCGICKVRRRTHVPTQHTISGHR